jgi:murein DD-endopeptidase MepM/ murein hydrolase activator NlpD
MRRHLKYAFLFTILLLVPISAIYGLTWPVWPDSSHQHIRGIYGSYWGENQFHSGVDIAVPPGTPAYAIESGYIKAIITLNNDNSYWRTVICDSAGTGITEGWMYAHIYPVTGLNVGDYVEVGTFLGNSAAWPLRPEVDPHLHLSRVRYWGDSANWADHFSDGWEFIGNPLDYLDDVARINDTTPPVLESAYLGGVIRPARAIRTLHVL